MKKIGKKLSFLTKIMLVIGLLISNLSSLSVVFADEVTMNVSIVDDKLNIKYLGQLADEVETVRVDVYENYTYFDMTSEKEVVNRYNLTPEELEMLVSSDENEFLIVDSVLLPSIVFDGTYNALVEVIDTTDGSDGELIDTCNFSMEVLHKSGLEVSVTDTTTGLELDKLEDGRHVVNYDKPNIRVTARVLAGGLNPTDKFTYEGSELPVDAVDLLKLEFTSEMDFSGHLYGDYKLPVEVNLLSSELEAITYMDTIDLLYGTYDMNTLIMNSALVEEELSLYESYVFDGNTKDGEIYVLLDESKANTMLDLYRIANFVLGDEENITYVLSNNEYDDVLDSYDEETNTNSREEYLESILLDDTAMLSLVNEGLTITYKVVILGDLNNDNVLTNDDVLELIEQVIGKTPVDEKKSNLYQDEEELDGVVDTLDVMYLDQVIKNESWNVELIKEEATFLSRLNVVQEDIVSGDEFTVNYVLTVSDYEVNGISGIFKYDEDMLELVSLKSIDEWQGNNNDGTFLYLGTDSLTGTEATDDNDGLIVTPNDYVVVTATFRALKSGTSLISVDNLEYFNQETYFVSNEMEEVSTLVVVNASDDNNLLSLNVAGVDITLVEDTLDYEITVGNDVTVASVEAILSNVAASITSIVSPEELVEGENTVTVTVTSESGNKKVYTITVIREKAKEETSTTTPINYNTDSSDSSYENNSDNEVVIPEPDNNKDEDNGDSQKEEGNISRIIIIILILLVIAGLIYLIFKDEDDEEAKKTNKDINKLKKDVKEPSKKVSNKTTNNDKNKSSGNKKKER